MSSGKNKSKSKTYTTTTSKTTDQRTTNTINAGIGGDIEDSFVVSGIHSVGDVTTTDFGAIEGGIKAANSAISGNTELAQTFIEQVGAFAGDITSDYKEIAQQSVSNLANIKSGETTAEPANRNLTELAEKGVWVAGIAAAAYAATQIAKRAKK